MEKSKLSKLFRSLRSTAEEMDHFENGNSSIVKHFNNFLSIAKKEGFIEDEGLFNELPANATPAEIFVDASLVSTYLKEDIRHRDEVHIQEIKIEEMENALRVKELKIEEQRLSKMEAELSIHERELANGEKVIDVDVDLRSKE